MCGRFVLDITWAEIKAYFNLEESHHGKFDNFNIAPASTHPVIVSKQSNHLVDMKWGLIPFWTKELKGESGLINARVETLKEKPSFKSAYKSRRCLIPASGFYEWQKEGSNKQPYYIYVPNQKLISLAGIWESYKFIIGEVTEILSFSIITTEANKYIKHIHDRMPITVDQKFHKEWLDSKELNFKTESEILKTASTIGFDFYPVSKDVNNPSNNSSNLLRKIF